jgi:hypothetical protein
VNRKIPSNNKEKLARLLKSRIRSSIIRDMNFYWVGLSNQCLHSLLNQEKFHEIPGNITQHLEVLSVALITAPLKAFKDSNKQANHPLEFQNKINSKPYPVHQIMVVLWFQDFLVFMHQGFEVSMNQCFRVLKY